MSKYVTDPELLAQLNASEEKPELYEADALVLAELNAGLGPGYVDDPELLAQLNASASGPVAPEGAGILGAVAPAVTGYGMQATGLGQMGRDAARAGAPLAQSVMQGGRAVADIYRARPIIAPLVDLAGMATMGVPPIAASQSAMGAYDKYRAIQSGKDIGSQVLSQGAPTAAGSTATRDAYLAMQKSVTPEIGKKLTELYGSQTGGSGNNAVRSWLTSAEGKAAQAANPGLAQTAARYLETVPGYGAQAMKIASPLLRAAARVAGPVGMAANLYEAAPYLSAAGPELTSGAAQNRMADAQRMMLNRPTPQPISPQEASNLLQSDDQRTISIYGGRANLEALVRSGLRQKAASKVLGPVAPGQ